MNELLQWNIGQMLELGGLGLLLIVIVILAFVFRTRRRWTLVPHFAPTNRSELRSWLVVLLFLLSLWPVGRISGYLPFPPWGLDHIVQLVCGFIGLIASFAYYRSKRPMLSLLITLLSVAGFFIGILMMPPAIVVM